jgi:hypothetical protein
MEFSPNGNEVGERTATPNSGRASPGTAGTPPTDEVAAGGSSVRERRTADAENAILEKK